MQNLRKREGNLILAYKNIGETVLEVVYKIKQELNIKEKMTFVGRLDPMAFGYFLILVGEECKNKEKYLGMDKEYFFDILVGVETDTLDILGKIINFNLNLSLGEDSEVKGVCEKLIGKIKLPYPKYSSKTFNGEYLFDSSDENYKKYLSEGEGKIQEKNIYDLVYINKRSCSFDLLIKEIEEKIKTLGEYDGVRKEFRQEEILNIWKNLVNEINERDLNYNLKSEFTLMSFKCVVSSGTYVRQISQEILKNLGLVGTTFCILRSRFGYFKKGELENYNNWF